ncbi:hypothetical protein [Nocardioides soli]|uniref:Uncharacterized protein n=1 Tax=Nocardioides soli TaxID=1036020 RepID=A0A7W4VYX8_9ACTN|nr:hypothetical protein [Nocardioides soli]MBB3044275.1 hypothetical protein [Nocardioides soli]
MVDLWARFGIAAFFVYGTVRHWPKRSPEAVELRLEQFAERFESPVRIEEASGVDGVIRGGDHFLSLAYAGLAVIALAWGPEPATTVGMIGATVLLGAVLALGATVRAFSRLEDRSPDGELVSSTDFQDPAERATPYALVVASVLAVVADHAVVGLAVAGAGLLGAVAMIGLDRWLFRLRFTPRDEHHAYVLDALRASIVARLYLVAVSWLVVLLAIGEHTEPWTALAVAVVVVPVVCTVVLGWSGSPRFVRRRWRERAARADAARTAKAPWWRRPRAVRRIRAGVPGSGGRPPVTGDPAPAPRN